MACHPNRTIHAKDRTKMQPDETIPILNGLVARFLHERYRRGAAKSLQREFGIGARAAEYVLAGDISAQMFRRFVAHYGAPLAQFMFQPAVRSAAGDAYLSHLDSIDHEFRNATEAASLASGQETGLADPRARLGGYLGVQEAAAAWVRNDAVRHPSATSAGEDARRLLMLCGTVDLVEDLPLSAACSAHAQLLEIGRHAGGFMTEPVVDHLRATKLAALTSVFGQGDQMPLLQMGSETRFWSEEQRRRMMGQPFDHIPAPAAFKHAVHSHLTEVRDTGRAALKRIKATCGGVTVEYVTLRVLDPISGFLLAFPSIAEAA